MPTSSFYAVVQYVPDPIRDERINVGVVVTTGTGAFVGAKFARDLQRARTLGAEDLGFLKDFAKSLEDLTVQPQLQLELGQAPQWDLAAIRAVHDHWGNSIQFSEPRAALEADPEKLLLEVFARYVSQTKQRETRVHDRRWVVAQAVPRLRAVAKERFPDLDVDQVVRRSQQVTGALDQHIFPVFLQRNGSSHAIEAISFESEDSDRLAREVEATAWAIDDVRKSRPDLPISVLAQDKTNSVHFRRAERIYKALEARVVRTVDIDAWAPQAVRALAEPTIARR